MKVNAEMKIIEKKEEALCLEKTNGALSPAMINGDLTADQSSGGLSPGIGNQKKIYRYFQLKEFLSIKSKWRGFIWLF